MLDKTAEELSSQLKNEENDRVTALQKDAADKEAAEKDAADKEAAKKAAAEKEAADKAARDKTAGRPILESNC